jgi:predicted dehydrogenase
MGLLRGALVNATRTHRVVGMVETSWKSRRFNMAAGIPAPLFPSLGAALGRVAADTCFVCTPPSAHAAVASAAMEAGLDCFIEKPLTTDPETSDAIVRRAEQTGRKAVVGYTRRFSPVIQRLRSKALAAGGPRSVRAVLLSPQFVGRSEEGAARGGVEWDLLVHATDAALYLGGSSADPQVEAVRRRGTEAVAVEARLDGVPVSLEADWACTDVRKVEMRCEVAAADGSVLGCDEDVVWRAEPGGQRETLFHRREAPPPSFDVAGADFSEEVADALDAFATDRAPGGTSLEEAAAVDRFVVSVIAADAAAWEPG